MGGGGGCLDLREEQVQMVKSRGEQERSQSEKNVLTAFGIMGEFIAGQRHLKLKENQDANSITESAVLNLIETGEIRELCSAILEIPENKAKSNWG